MVQEPLPDRNRPSDNSGSDTVATRSIFRPQALEQYARNQDRAVFPRLVSPRSFRLLWILAIVLMVLGLLIAFWPVLAPMLDGLP